MIDQIYILIKRKAWEKSISNAFLIVHHNLHQLLFSVKLNPDKSILYLTKFVVNEKVNITNTKRI